MTHNFLKTMLAMCACALLLILVGMLSACGVADSSQTHNTTIVASGSSNSTTPISLSITPVIAADTPTAYDFHWLDPLYEEYGSNSSSGMTWDIYIDGSISIAGINTTHYLGWAPPSNGNYKISIKNSLGQESQAVTLIVASVPAARWEE